MATFVLALCAILGIAAVEDGPPPELSTAERVAELVTRVEQPDEDARKALRAELLALAEVDEPLFHLLADWRTPTTEEGGEQRLDLGQRELVLAAVRELPRGNWKELRAALPSESAAQRLRAGLRLEGELATSVRSLYVLAERAVELQSYGETADAFEDGLVRFLAREPRGHGPLTSAWRELSPQPAESVVRALARTPSRAALESLSSWLGRREELDVGILLALGSLHAFVDRERDEDLVREVQSYLSSRDSTRIQAAATALGRLGTAESVPWLIELLVHEDAPVQRTALAALRSIGGVRLPGSVSAWRAWYAREETWFQEHAPALLEELVTAEESAEATTRVRAVLASLTEHRLHRDELFTHLEPLFAHERPRLRVLACQAAERLASRRALPTLVAMLRDVEENVVSAACAALRTFEGVILPPDPLVWSQRLGLAPSQDGS